MLRQLPVCVPRRAEPLNRVGDLPVRNEAEKAGLGFGDGGVDDLLVKAQLLVRQVGELYLFIPMALIAELLDLPNESGRLGQFQASDREEAIVRDAAGLVQEDRGDRVVGRQCGRLRAASGSRHKEEYLPSST